MLPLWIIVVYLVDSFRIYYTRTYMDVIVNEYCIITILHFGPIQENIEKKKVDISKLLFL